MKQLPVTRVSCEKEIHLLKCLRKKGWKSAAERYKTASSFYSWRSIKTFLEINIALLLRKIVFKSFFFVFLRKTTDSTKCKTVYVINVSATALVILQHITLVTTKFPHIHCRLLRTKKVTILPSDTIFRSKLLWMFRYIKARPAFSGERRNVWID